MIGAFRRGSFVRPDLYPQPGSVIETFEAFKRTPEGEVIRNYDDMRIMFKPVDMGTWEEIGPAEEMTQEIWDGLIDTRDHPHFL